MPARHDATPMPFVRLALLQLWRDLRAGQLRLLLVAVSLAVAALSAVGFFADRLQAGMERDARQLLGGDAVIVSDQTPPSALQALVPRFGLRSATSLAFPTMASASEDRGGATRLVALKAVEAGYPLRGQLVVRAGERADPAPANGIPAPGEAWVDPAVLDALALQVGDSLRLGESAFRISRLIDIEPDRGAGFVNFSPRVMIRSGDLAATQLVQPASRITWRVAVAGDDAQVRRFLRTANTLIEGDGMRGVRTESLEGGRPEMSQTLDRAQKFLNLVALLAALLSAVAVGLAARTFAQRRLDDCAMLRVLGVSQGTMARSLTLEFLAVGLVGGGLGVLIGWAVHHAFVLLLAGLIDTALPAPGPWPALLGLGVGLTLMVTFGLPPVLQLARVPPLRVIRRDVGGLRPFSAGVLALGVGGYAALLLAVSRDPTLGLITVGGFAAAVALFALAAWAAVRLLRRLVHEESAPRWLVLATRQVCARPGYAVLQVSSLAVGLLALLLLVLLRTDLIRNWQQATPANAPDRFVINILPDQAQDFRKALADAGVAPGYDWYPMIRGRLVAVNDKPVVVQDYPDDRARRLVDREFNLSYTATLPAHNPVVGGRWTPGDGKGISMEQGLAQTLGLHLGDRLRFDVAGVIRDSTITSLRKVDWSSMRANFFALYPVDQMPPELPVTYLAAFRSPPQARPDSALVRQFPNVTVVDLSLTLAQIQRVLGQVTQAVELLFGFTLLAGLVVLTASVTATREARAREYAVMRAVGAGAGLLRLMQRAELVGIGFLAGTLAAVAASAVGWALTRYVFSFDAPPSLWLLPVGAASGALLAWLAGWWGLRTVLRQPVVQTLRQAAT